MPDPSQNSSLTEREIRQIREILFEWGDNHFQEYPWRNPEIDWHGLAAEILLQRTKADSVVPVYEEFVDRFPEPEDLAGATEGEILDVMGSLGLHWRASRLRELGESLCERSEIPRTLEELKELPGIGTYAAAAWMSFHGGSPAALVDANIVRWVCRILGREYDGETRRKRWLRNAIERLTPEERHRDFNYALLDFTMTVCSPRTPDCPSCPIGPEICEHGARRLKE